MPPISWKVTVQQHPGSSWDDILNEPKWSTGHNHRIGYKNNQDRVAGITHAQDELSREDEEAHEGFRELKDDAKKGKLLNFRDVVNGQKVRRMYLKKHRPRRFLRPSRTFTYKIQKTAR